MLPHRSQQALRIHQESSVKKRIIAWFNVAIAHAASVPELVGISRDSKPSLSFGVLRLRSPPFGVLRLSSPPSGVLRLSSGCFASPRFPSLTFVVLRPASCPLASTRLILPFLDWLMSTVELPRLKSSDAVGLTSYSRVTFDVFWSPWRHKMSTRFTHNTRW